VINWIFNREVQLRYLIPFGLVLLNFILKIWYLDSQSIANDEPFSIFVAQMDVSSIISELSSGNNPPFFEMMLHYWIKCFGISPFSVRFLPFVFSVATVIIIYKLARLYFSFQVAIMTSLIFSFSNYHLYFAHETRVYSFFTLMTCISMFAFLKVIEIENSRKYWLLLLFANLLLCYSHYFGLFIPLIQAVCVFFIKELRMKILKYFVFVIAVFLLLYAPMIPVVITQFLSSSEGTWVQPATYEDFYTMLWRFSNVPVLTVFFITTLIIAIVKWMLFEKNEVLNINTKVVAVWFLLPYLFMFFVSLKCWLHPIPVFIDRYVIFISIAFYFSVSIALNYLLRKVKLKLIFYLIPVLILLMTFEINVHNKRNVREVVTKIEREMKGDTKLVICPEFYDLNIAYYLMRNQFKPNNNCFKDSLVYKMAINGIFPLTNKHELSKVQIYKTKKLIYLDAAADFLCPKNEVFDSLTKYYGKYKKFEYPEIFKLYVFEK
jgi:hypothetical protein